MGTTPGAGFSAVAGISLMLICVGGQAIRAEPPAGISLLRTPPTAVGRYHTYEVSFRLGRVYQNPFDPEHIDVTGVFVAPSGEEVRLPGFLYAHPEQEWRLRFAPRELGRHQVRIVARDETSQRELALPSFKVIPSDSPGFVRCTEQEPWRFVFDSGTTFLPISIVLWGGFLSAHADQLPLLRQAGINHFRLLMGDRHAGGAYALEHGGLPAGEYDLSHADSLDRLFGQLGALDMYATLNLIEHAEFRVSEPYHWFLENPYHVENGGPCERPSDFFASPQARKLFRQRLRYLVARWGHSPRLLMFQLWAEVDFSDGYAADPGAVRDWHREMSDYLHQIDPYGHLVSTSVTFRGLSSAYARAGIFDLPGIDVAATEMYNERDMAEAVRQDAQHVMEAYGKPQMLVECGLQHEMLADEDAWGVHLHAALWSSVMSGSAGTPAFWWWSKILENDWLWSFRALARYLEGEDLAELRTVEAKELTYRSAPAEPIYGDLSLPLPVEDPAWGMRSESGALSIVVPNDGRFPDVPVPRTLPPHRSIAFDVGYAAEGAFVFAGWWLPDTGTARVRIRIDGVDARAVDLPGVGWGDRFERYREYLGVPYVVPVPRGRHQIVVENVGDAWVTMSVDFASLLRPERPNLRAYGLADEERAFLWVANRDNTWWRNRTGKAPRPVRDAVVTLEGMRPGAYATEWWDTRAGIVTARDTASVGGDGLLALPAPEVERDVACKIRRQDEESP